MQLLQAFLNCLKNVLKENVLIKAFTNLLITKYRCLES